MLHEPPGSEVLVSGFIGFVSFRIRLARFIGFLRFTWFFRVDRVQGFGAREIDDRSASGFREFWGPGSRVQVADPQVLLGFRVPY